jgi:hypothetical protein
MPDATRSSPPHRLLQRRHKRPRAVMMPEAFIQGLEPLDEIGDFLPRIRSACFGAEVGAASEGPVFVDRATTVRSKQGTGTIRMRFQGRASRGTHAFCRIEGLGFRHLRRPASEPEMAAARAQDAITMHRPRLDRRVDRAQFGDGFGIERRTGGTRHGSDLPRTNPAPAWDDQYRSRLPRS